MHDLEFKNAPTVELALTSLLFLIPAYVAYTKRLYHVAALLLVATLISACHHAWLCQHPQLQYLDRSVATTLIASLILLCVMFGTCWYSTVGWALSLVGVAVFYYSRYTHSISMHAAAHIIGTICLLCFVNAYPNFKK